MVHGIGNVNLELPTELMNHAWSDDGDDRDADPQTSKEELMARLSLQ